MTFEEWFAASATPDSMKHDLFDCWFQALVSRDAEVAKLRQQLVEFKHGQDTYQQLFNDQKAENIRMRQQVTLLRDAILAFQKQYPHMNKGYLIDALAATKEQ